MRNFFLYLLFILANTAVAQIRYADFLEEDAKLLEQKMGPELLGKHSFDPQSAEYAARVMLIGEMTEDVKRFPQISYEDLKSIQDISAPLNKLAVKGIHNNGIFHAKLGAKNVVLKLAAIHPASAQLFLKENFYLLLINQLGLGPEYYGWTQTPWGKALVMEKIEGVPLRSASEETRALINHETMEDFIDIFMKLAQAGIFPKDYQLMIDQKGRLHLVDVGDFKIWGAHPPRFAPAIDAVERENAKLLFELMGVPSPPAKRPTWNDLFIYIQEAADKLFDYGTHEHQLFQFVFDERVKIEEFPLQEIHRSPLEQLSFESRLKFRESFRRVHGR